MSLPNGGPAFFGVMAAFLVWRVVRPALLALWRLPVKPAAKHTPSAPSAPSGVLPTAVSVGLIFLGLGGALNVQGQPAPVGTAMDSVMAESVIQQITIDDQYAQASAKIHWRAVRGQSLPLLAGSAASQKSGAKP